MPTYDYQCPACQRVSERFCKVEDRDKPLICPGDRSGDKCDTKMERQPSAGSGIIFKGTGFYETDYKRKR